MTPTFQAQAFRPLLNTVSVIETSEKGNLYAYTVLFDASGSNARVVDCFNADTLDRRRASARSKQQVLTAANAEWSRYRTAARGAATALPSTGEALKASRA